MPFKVAKASLVLHLGTIPVGSGRAGSGHKNSGNFGSKRKFKGLIFQFFLIIQSVTAFRDLFNAVSNKSNA